MKLKTNVEIFISIDGCWGTLICTIKRLIMRRDSSSVDTRCERALLSNDFHELVSLVLSKMWLCRLLDV